MNRVRKLAVRCFVAVVAAAVFSFVYFHIALYLDMMPIGEAADAIRPVLKSRGYDLQGYFGDFVQQPDDVGGMEVRIQFYDQSSDQNERHVTVQVKRSWEFGSWHITKLTTDEMK